MLQILVIFFQIVSYEIIYCSKVEVWLTVSSLANLKSQRNIELHWRNGNASTGDWIGLFLKDPSNLHPLEGNARKVINVNGQNSGFNVTDVEYPHITFPTVNIPNGCLGFYIGYVHSGQLIAKNCIRNNVFWMEEHLDVIGSKPLTDIVIPGTHDAGSCEKYVPEWDSVLRRFQMTQDECIYNQLVYGIRYLDIRLGIHNVSGSNETYWIVHGELRSNNTLKSVAQQIRDFLKIAPKEIVIFDFHLFETGFEQTNDFITLKARYKEFFDIISHYLKDYMIPFSLGFNVTVNHLIQINKRVLIGFSQKNSNYLESDLLWPNVQHQWGNKDELTALEKYFESTLCSAKPTHLRSAMAEMTPNLDGIINKKYTGLRPLAHEVNMRYTDWFKDRWWNCVNIVAADYFLGSNIVEIAIDNNIRKSHKYY